MDVEKTETCALLMAVYNVTAATKISRALPKEKDKCRMYHLIQHSTLGCTPKRIQSHGLKQVFVHQCSCRQCSQQTKGRKRPKRCQQISRQAKCERHITQEILAHALTSMNVEPITRSEMSQSQKNMLRMMSLL